MTKGTDYFLMERGIILSVTIAMHACVRACACTYPVCLGHEETLRHPWASRGVVVHQIGVGSLERSKDAVIALRCYRAVEKQVCHYFNCSPGARGALFYFILLLFPLFWAAKHQKLQRWLRFPGRGLDCILSFFFFRFYFLLHTSSPKMSPWPLGGGGLPSAVGSPPCTESAGPLGC